MRLTKIHVAGFGKLRDYTLEPKAGLNRLEYPNGWGKTTLASFLCAMLFGLPGNRDAIHKNLRQQYTPWEGGSYGGYIELSSALGDFRIERRFDPLSITRDELLVIDKSTGRETTLLGENPGETLFGINVEGFEKSAYLTQKEIDLTPGALSSITDRLHKMLDNVEDVGSYDRAVKLIERLKKDLRSPTGGVKIQQLELQYADLKRLIEQLTRQQGDLRALEAERDNCLIELASLEGAKEQFRRRREVAARLEERCRLVAEIDRQKAEIAGLERVFRGKMLAKESYAEIADACKNLQAATSFASTLDRAFPKAEYEALDRRYPTGIPDESAIAAAEEIAAQRGAAQASLDLLAKGKPQKKPLRTLLPAVLLLAVGLGLLFPAVFGASPLFLVGAVPALVGGTLLLILSLLRRSKINLLAEQIAKLDIAFGDKLSFYHGKPADEALCRRLREDAARMQTLEAEKARLDEALANKKTLADRLSDFFATYGSEEDGGDPAATLARLQEASRKLEWTNSLLADKEKALTEFDRSHPLSSEEIASTPLFEDLPDWDEKRRELTAHAQELERKIGAMSAEIDQIPELADRLANMEEELRERKTKYYILEKTQNFLQTAKDSLSARYRDGLEQSFPGFLRRLSGEDVPEARLDPDMRITLYGGGKSRPIAVFSQGMQDLTDFCLRLSLTEALTDRNEPPFLLLDDPFVNLDDDRYEAARNLLDDLANTYQIFYFVCRKERE